MQDSGIGVDRVADSVAFLVSRWGRSSSCRSRSCAPSAWCGRRLSRALAAPASSPGAHPCAHRALEQDRLRSARQHPARDDRSDLSRARRRRFHLRRAIRRVLQTPDESSRRLARNTQIILKQEALLSRVADPGGGSYLLEALTNSIARRPGSCFRNSKRRAVIERRRRMIAQTLERAKSGAREERWSPAAAFSPAQTALRMLPSRRSIASMSIAHRDSCRARACPSKNCACAPSVQQSKPAKTPRILLAEIGDAKMRSARSQFAADFLACAGLATEIERFRDAAADCRQRMPT